MNTHLKIISKMIIPALLMASSLASAYDSYQEKVLFTPSEGILHAEAKGRVMIYDGLDNEMVELAMNEQFQRIENMMFVRTQYISEDGDIEIEEDGCD
ncbi:MAG: hypothetical protein GY806_00395 [Gammaproteobacteria bacterium]|nr:hypothetical protein [Gammaproteobacteria bacterium]